MTVPSCVWMTVQEWSDLDGVDPDFWDPFIPFAGSTYINTCQDGTVMLNGTFTDAVRNA